MSNKHISKRDNKSEEWFWAEEDADSPKGPVKWDELKRMARKDELKPSSLVWREGLDGWIEAGSIEDLFSSPPPLPTETDNNISGSPTPTSAEGAAEPPEESDSEKHSSTEEPDGRTEAEDSGPGFLFTASNILLTLISLALLVLSPFLLYRSFPNKISVLLCSTLFATGFFFILSYVLYIYNFYYSYISIIMGYFLYIFSSVFYSLANLVNLYLTPIYARDDEGSLYYYLFYIFIISISYYPIYKIAITKKYRLAKEIFHVFPSGGVFRRVKRFKPLPASSYLSTAGVAFSLVGLSLYLSGGVDLANFRDSFERLEDRFEPLERVKAENVSSPHAYSADATEVMRDMGYNANYEYIWVGTLLKKENTTEGKSCILFFRKKMEEYEFMYEIGECSRSDLITKGRGTVFYKGGTRDSEKAKKIFNQYLIDKLQ